MLSYWEKKNLLNYDLLVIGAGFVGLSTAIHFKEKYLDKSVLVLERGIFPSGASTRNAGFACFGSLSEIQDDRNHRPESEVVELVRLRWSGLRNIRKVFGDAALEYSNTGGYDLIKREDEKVLEEMENINSLLAPIFKDQVFELVDPKSFGFSPRVSHLVRNNYEGQLDPAKYIKCLWQKCRELHIAVLTGVEVHKVDDEACKAYASSYSGDEVTFKSEFLAVCTNAFTGQLIQGLDIQPGRGMILLSKPLAHFPWQGTFHLDRGYVYFRNVDDRLLIGGGRNIAEAEETTTRLGINKEIAAYLKEMTTQVIFPGKTIGWDMEWSGIMAFGLSKKPIVQMVNQRAGVAVRLGGMGVAIGWETGKALVDLLVS
ncbi:FAD-dependent oxidoreductase [Echinicola sediminis]